MRKNQAVQPSKFRIPRMIPASAIPPPPTFAGSAFIALRPMKPAMIAGMPVSGPKHISTPHTNATTLAVLAGGFSPRGMPVLGSMLI